MSAGEEYKATKDLWLSPQSRLLADAPGGTDFVYNGGGHRLILPEGLHEGEALPLIIIGVGKSLQLKDMKLVHAASLPACIQLGSGECPLPVTAGDGDTSIVRLCRLYSLLKHKLSACKASWASLAGFLAWP